MLGKRETAEDVDAVVPQRLRDKAKTGLSEPKWPGAQPHADASRSHAFGFARGRPCLLDDVE
jgi:hypothetical protein